MIFDEWFDSNRWSIYLFFLNNVNVITLILYLKHTVVLVDAGGGDDEFLDVESEFFNPVDWEEDDDFSFTAPIASLIGILSFLTLVSLSWDLLLLSWSFFAAKSSFELVFESISSSFLRFNIPFLDPIFYYNFWK